MMMSLYFIYFKNNFFYVSSVLYSRKNTSGMDDMVMEEEDDCPELVPIENPPCPPLEQIPVTIITGYLGKRHL